MAKNLKIFSQLFLGVASVATLSFAVSHKPVYACGEGTLTNGEVVENCVESTEEKTDGTYFEAGLEVKSGHTTDHSLFLAGNEVISEDYVDGVNFAAGNIVQLNGSAEYSVVAGNSVVVASEVEKDLFVAGNAVTLDEGLNVGRDVFAVGNTILIKSNLHGNVFTAGNRLVLENVTIDGNLDVEFDEIVIKGKSSVAGTFKYNDNAIITGLENLSFGEKETFHVEERTVSFGARLADKVLFLLGRLLVTIIALALAAKFVKKSLSSYELKNSWKDILLGLGLLLGVPLASIFILATIIGLPLGLIMLAVYGILAYFSHSATGVVVGELLAKHVFKQEKMHTFLKATIGIVLVSVLSLVPYVGGLVTALSVCFGFGFLVRNIFRRESKVKK